jgi:TPP-dependent 2-oxoacid decarboxylase
MRELTENSQVNLSFTKVDYDFISVSGATWVITHIKKSPALFSDVTGFNQTLFVADRVPAMIQQACNSALSEKGVAHIALPADVATENVERDITGHPIADIETGNTRPLVSALNNALSLIQQAKNCCSSGCLVSLKFAQVFLWAESFPVFPV